MFFDLFGDRRFRVDFNFFNAEMIEKSKEYMSIHSQSNVMYT